MAAETVRSCLTQETDIALSPLLRPADLRSDCVYSAIRRFIAGNTERFGFQSELLELGVPEISVFHNAVQVLIQKHEESGETHFAELRRALMHAGVADLPILPVPRLTHLPVVDFGDVSRNAATARPSTNRATYRSIYQTPRTARYEKLPLKKGSNPLLDDKINLIRGKILKERQNLCKVLQTRPVATPILTILPRSFVEKTLAEARSRGFLSARE